jgi:hypothetical protein
MTMSHAEMRANAKRKLQEQLERRMLQQERRRRMAPYAGVILALLALVVVLMYIFSRPAPLDTPTQITPPLAPVTTTTTPYQPDWKQYCATHIDTVECGNGSDVTPTTTAPMPAWPPGSGPCTVHPHEAPEGCVDTTTPQPTTLPPWTPITTLPPQISVPGVPMAPPPGDG